MMLKDNEKGFGLITKIIHWISAFFFLAGFVFVQSMDNPMYTEEERVAIMGNHITFGILFLASSLIRVAWRFFNIRPEDQSISHKNFKIAAQELRLTFYVLILLVPISGTLTYLAGDAVYLFMNSIEVPSSLVDIDIGDISAYIHELFGYLIIGLVIIHISASLIHQFYLKDKSLINFIKISKSKENS